MIVSFLSKRGFKINYLLIRLYIIKYIHQYWKITSEENGKPGYLFYAFIGTINAALLFTIVGIILRNILK